MKKNHIISFAVAVVAAILCLSSCSGIKKLEDLEITSAKISGLTPKGLKAVDLEFRVGVDNPGTQLTLSEISFDIKHFGKVLGKVAVDPFTLKARTEDTYEIEAEAKLGEGVTVMDLGRLLDKNAADQMTVDLKAKVKVKGGPSKNVKFNDLPLKKLIETAKK